MVEVKWEIVTTVVLGFFLLIGWVFYGLRTNKLAIDPILRHRDHEPLAHSNFFSTLTFGIIRSCIAIYIIIVWCYALSESRAAKYFSFYTVWNYTICMIYFISVSTITLLTALTPNGISQYSKSANTWRVATWIIFMTECAVALLVDITVWTILYEEADSSGKESFLEFGSINMHMLNVVFLYFDLIVNCVPIYFHFGWTVVIMGLFYAIFSWIYYDVEHVWRYFFIDSEKEIDALWYLLVFGMHLFSWIVVYSLGKYKIDNFSNPRRMSDIDKLLNIGGQMAYVSVNDDGHAKDDSDHTRSGNTIEIETSIQQHAMTGDL